MTSAPPRSRLARPRPVWRALLLLAAIVAVAVIGARLAPYAPAALTGEPLERPGRRHLLGTNNVGQDLASQLLVGARASLLIALGAAALSTTVGAALGAAAAWSRPGVDRALMRLVDVALAVPRLPLLIVLAAYAGGSALGTAVVIGAVFWPVTARVVRGRLVGLRGAGHVRAAYGFGATTAQVLRRHVLPELVPLASATAVLAASRAVMMESGLALLGIGDVSRTSWGTTLREALDFRSLFRIDAWRWWLVPPIVAVSAFTMALGAIGQQFERAAAPASAAR